MEHVTSENGGWIVAAGVAMLSSLLHFFGSRSNEKYRAKLEKEAEEWKEQEENRKLQLDALDDEMSSLRAMLAEDHTEVEVLKSQRVDMSRQIEEIRESQSQNNATILTRLDTLLNTLNQPVRVR